MSTPFHQAVAYMRSPNLRLRSVVVSLDMTLDESREDVEFFPVIHEAIDDTGQIRFGTYTRLAALVWDAAEEQAARGQLDLEGPVRLAVPGGLTAVEWSPCPDCQDQDPWLCEGSCSRTGHVYVRKAA